MNSCDIFQIEERSMKLYRDLENNNFSKFESDNFILKKYADAKFLGHYKYLVYDVNSPKKTIYKNLISLRKIIESVNKPLIELTEKDIMVFQIKLNQNKILCKDTKRPIAYSYKYDLVKNLRQFWNFYRMYSRYEKNEKIENITEFLMLRREYNVNKLIEFLTLNEIERLVLNARSLKMRTLIKVCFETGARPVEILNLRKFNCNFKDGKWIIKLPNMKGNSTEKMPIEIDYAYEEFNEWMIMNDFSEEELIFDYSYETLRFYLKRLGKNVIGKNVTPKLFRKSCAMFLVNKDINEQYIKSHMGWSAGSKSIKYYISQRAIKKPERLKYC